MSKTIKDAVEALNMQYSYALDNKDMAGWLACFANDPKSSYYCLSAENAEHGLAIGFMHDDNYGRLQDRVTFVTQVWQGTFQDYRTRHFVQIMRIEPSSEQDGVHKVLSNFNILYTPNDTSKTEVLASGRYEDEIRFDGENAKYLTRRAIIDSPVLPRYLVYPL